MERASIPPHGAIPASPSRFMLEWQLAGAEVCRLYVRHQEVRAMARRIGHLGGFFLLAMLASAGPAQAQVKGSIVGWGDVVVVGPSAFKNLMAIAAGSQHSLGLKSDGAVVAWGTTPTDSVNCRRQTRVSWR